MAIITESAHAGAPRDTGAIVANPDFDRIAAFARGHRKGGPEAPAANPEPTLNIVIQGRSAEDCIGMTSDNDPWNGCFAERITVMQTSFANWMLAARRRSFVAASALIVALPLLLLAERAKALGDPQAVVAYVVAQGMAAVGPNVSPAQRNATLRGLFDRYFDGDASAEFALGGHRRIATPQQQQEFFRLYAEYTVRTYGERLSQIGAAPFRVTGGRVYGRQAVVTSEVSRSGGNPVELSWSLINRHGNFKIADLSIGGASMRVTQREEFSRWVQNNGGRFDALLAVMRQQIAQMH